VVNRYIFEVAVLAAHAPVPEASRSASAPGTDGRPGQLLGGRRQPGTRFAGMLRAHPVARALAWAA
jgi:hypothetical protein